MRELSLNEIDEVVFGVCTADGKAYSTGYTLVTVLPNGYATQVCGENGEWSSFSTFQYS